MPRQKKCRHRADGEECLLTFPFIGLACFPPYSTRRYSKILLLRKGLSEFRLTALERMAGTTRLEPRGLCRDRKKVRIGNGKSASLQRLVRHCWRVCRYLRVKLPTSRFLAPNRFLSTAV